MGVATSQTWTADVDEDGDGCPYIEDPSEYETVQHTYHSMIAEVASQMGRVPVSELSVQFPRLHCLVTSLLYRADALTLLSMYLFQVTCSHPSFIHSYAFDLELPNVHMQFSLGAVMLGAGCCGAGC